MKSNKCIALILAGGQGKRLEDLTHYTAKPAIPFGGNYRIIDFTLSNCCNSGISTVGVLTQYQPLELSDYIGNGKTWDLDRLRGGITLLPPYTKKNGNDWYKGTANAVFQNMHFVDDFNPEYVIILSGDHIYKMNYSQMLSFHIRNKADCTIATTTVSINEAKRFGLVVTGNDNRITEFEEKPLIPKSTQASMGIYIFNRKILKKYLTLDNANENSTNDFGKDVLPAMLYDNCKMFSYPFSGYWRDVGTVESLWKANMDLLSYSILDQNPGWKIYSKTNVFSPSLISGNARIRNSIISEGCVINGIVENSVIFGGVRISENARIRNSVIFPFSTVAKNSYILNSIIDENSKIGKNCIIGEEKFITLIKRNSKIHSTYFEMQKSVVS